MVPTQHAQLSINTAQTTFVLGMQYRADGAAWLHESPVVELVNSDPGSIRVPIGICVGFCVKIALCRVCRFGGVLSVIIVAFWKLVHGEASDSYLIFP